MAADRCRTREQTSSPTEPVTFSTLADSDLNDPTDHVYNGQDTAQRYLGHQQAAYGFVLFTPAMPNGEDLILPLNPQSIEQEEEAAITITPTQGGGKLV